MAVSTNFALAERCAQEYLLVTREPPIPLTSGSGRLYLAQPLERSSDQMRNKITELLIIVVPRHIAGGG